MYFHLGSVIDGHALVGVLTFPSPIEPMYTLILSLLSCRCVLFSPIETVPFLIISLLSYRCVVCCPKLLPFS